MSGLIGGAFAGQPGNLLGVFDSVSGNELVKGASIRIWDALRVDLCALSMVRVPYSELLNAYFSVLSSHRPKTWSSC